MKAKVDRECVNSLLRILKIIMMSSFCANSPNIELKEQMQRRMSSVVEEEIELFEDKKVEEVVPASDN